MSIEVIYQAEDPETIRLIEKGVPIEELERRMKPSSDSAWGMLGPNESLVDVIVSDNHILQKIGVSYDELATKIKDIFDIKGIISILPGGYLTLTEMTCGSKYCPWEDGHDDGEFYMMLLNPQNSEHRSFLEYWKNQGIPNNKEFKGMFTGEPAMIVSGLMPHLIKDHHLFEGKETAYRCDPKQLIRYLNI